MEPDLAQPGPPTEPATPRPGPPDAPPSAPFSPLVGVRGALIAIAVSGLVILGLWLVARDGPSAGIDPRLVPVTAAAGTPAGTPAAVAPEAVAPAAVAPEAGAPTGRSGPFGNQTFATVVPQPGPRSPAATAGETDES